MGIPRAAASSGVAAGAAVPRVASSPQIHDADDLARSSNKNKGTDEFSNSCKKNKKTCDGGGKTADSFISDVLNEDPFSNVDSMGYPKLVKDVPGGFAFFPLTNGQNYGMEGKKRFLHAQIKVLLPNKECRGGALHHYNLHYNVALVNVKDFTAPHPVNIQPQSNYSSELVVVGRCFKSGILMAARGQHAEVLNKLDCKLVKYSTCKITKAGIGGPLVDSDGKFIGMNFCGKDLYAMNLHAIKRTWTPFIPSDVILDVLAYFKTKRTVAEVGLDGYASGGLDWVINGDSSVRLNSWPVPKANYYPRQFADLEAPPKPKKRIRVNNPVVRIVDGKEYWLL